METVMWTIMFAVVLVTLITVAAGYAKNQQRKYEEVEYPTNSIEKNSNEA
jgi:nitric oxide reductase large subunit